MIGLTVFGEMIAGRNVIIYSDNTGAEAATRKGTTKNFDQHSLVHCIWKKLTLLDAGVWVLRVPTDDNIADCPSRQVSAMSLNFALDVFPCNILSSTTREQYHLLAKLGAVELPAHLDSFFKNSQSWEALSIKNVLSLSSKATSVAV